jgi:sodium transport system permease protein
MNWQTLKLLYIHEIRTLVRARRTVVMAIVIPTVVMPVMLFASKYANDQRQRALTQTTYLYAIRGSMADRVRSLIAQAGSAPATDSDEDRESLKEFKIREVQVSDPAASLERGEIHFYLQMYSGEEADALPELKSDSDDEDSTPARTPPRPKRLKGVPLLRVVYRGSAVASNNAEKRMVSLLRRGQRNDVHAMLVSRGFQIEPDNTFAVDASSIATAGQVTGANIGRFVTVFLVMLMLTGGSIAALDTIAGEKERGTIETLLTTAASRQEIVTAKQMTISSVALIITLIQAANFLIYVKLKVVPLPPNFVLQVPLSAVFTLLLLYIPLAATIASVLLIISAYAKTYKEAQMYFFPVHLTSLFPALAGVLPGLTLRSAIVLVPLANVSVAVREIMTDRPDWPMIAVTFLIMTFTAGMLMRTSARMLAREDIIVPAQSEPEIFLGGRALFQKRVLRWFAVLWAIVFAVAFNVPELSTFRAQLAFNEFVIFGGAGILMLYTYRLNIRETLSLRPVKWPVWIAVVLAAPAANLMGVALFKLLGTVLPIPSQAVEQMDAFFPKNIPPWEMYVWLGLIPGVIEELTFRGLLLSGLRHRIRPVLLPLVVGIIFGLFHFSLFRIGPTAFLGILLTIIAMLTGSVLPGIVLHILNNSFAYWASTQGWPLGSFSPWHYALATLIFGLTMWIIYRNRQEKRLTIT